MWRLRGTTGVLGKHEAVVFTDAVGMMADDLVDEMNGGIQTTYGIPCFDRLNSGRRLRLLKEVLTGLIDPCIPIPDFTVYFEGTIAAILKHTAEMVRQEIEFELLQYPLPEFDSYSWRRVVWPCIANEEAKPEVLTSSDCNAWEQAIEAIRLRLNGGGIDSSAAGRLAAGSGRLTDVSDERVVGEEARFSALPRTPDAEEIQVLWKQLRIRTHLFCEPC